MQLNVAPMIVRILEQKRTKLQHLSTSSIQFLTSAQTIVTRSILERVLTLAQRG
jgi:hypothetical protein